MPPLGVVPCESHRHLEDDETSTQYPGEKERARSDSDWKVANDPIGNGQGSGTPYAGCGTFP